MKIKIRASGLLEYVIAGLLVLLPWPVHSVLVANANQYAEIRLYGFDLVALVLLMVWLWYWYHSRPGADWPVMALGLVCVVVVILSGYWATNRDVAFYYWVRFALGMALIGIMATAPVRLRLMGYCLVFNGLIETIFSWLQFMMQSVIGQKWLGMAEQSPITSGTAVVVNATGRWLRAYGTLPHPNITGGMIVVALVAGATLWPLARRSWERSWLLAVMCVLSSGLLLIFSRSALMVWCIVAVVGLWQWREQRAALTTSLITLVIVSVPLWPLVSARFDTGIYTERTSLAERSNQLQTALGLWSRYWPMGVGIGQYTLQASTPKTDPQPVHLVPLLIAIEIGAIATIFWYWLIIHALWKTRWRSLASRSTAVLLLTVLGLGLFDHYFWTIPSLFLLWCCLIGWQLHYSKAHSEHST